MPKISKVMIWLPPSEALIGLHDRHRLNFQHFDLSNISAKVNGQMHPNKRYKLDFAHNSPLAAHKRLLDCLEGLNKPDREIVLNRQYGSGGFKLYGFDFTPGHAGRGAVSLMKQEKLNVSLRFAKPLPVGVVCNTKLVYDNVIEIDNNRQVLFDFVP